jgi:hypothetical protein
MCGGAGNIIVHAEHHLFLSFFWLQRDEKMSWVFGVKGRTLMLDPSHLAETLDCLQYINV